MVVASSLPRFFNRSSNNWMDDCIAYTLTNWSDPCNSSSHNEVFPTPAGPEMMTTRFGAFIQSVFLHFLVSEFRISFGFRDSDFGFSLNVLHLLADLFQLRFQVHHLAGN